MTTIRSLVCAGPQYQPRTFVLIEKPPSHFPDHVREREKRRDSAHTIKPRHLPIKCQFIFDMPPIMARQTAFACTVRATILRYVMSKVPSGLDRALLWPMGIAFRLESLDLRPNLTSLSQRVARKGYCLAPGPNTILLKWSHCNKNKKHLVRGHTILQKNVNNQ